MAYSTQKDFFHDFSQIVCEKACVKLKSYESATDERSWAPDDQKQSKYLADLVACATVCGSDDRQDKMESLGGHGGAIRKCGDGDNLLAKFGIKPADSLIQRTNELLRCLENLGSEKEQLQEQLCRSEENLKVYRDENQRFKDILNRRFDENDLNDFCNKVQKLSNSGKFTKADEKDLLQFLQKMRDLIKHNELINAEKCYLQRLIEKLNLRSQITDIKCQPETSKDVKYLQDEVNCLRKEVLLLRKFEDKELRHQQQTECVDGTGVSDVENIKLIVKERNSLREKLESFKDLEKKVCEMQKRLQEAGKVNSNLSSKGESQSGYIKGLEQEMKNMQAFYENRERDFKEREDCMKRKMEDLRNELCRLRNEVNKCQCLQMENNCLRKELESCDEKLNEYDCQFKELMCVIAELRGKGPCDSQDNETQTCSDYLDDLAFFTTATLKEIIKELEKRGIYLDGDLESNGMSPEECCKEMERLRDLVDQLQKTNNRLSATLQGHSKSLDDLSKKVDGYGKDVSQTIKDTAQVGKELDEAYKLVNDITDVQQTNQQLSNAVHNLSNKEKDDLIDDLKKQLKNCMDEKNQIAKALKEKEAAKPPPTTAKPDEPTTSAARPAPAKEPSTGPATADTTKTDAPAKAPEAPAKTPEAPAKTPEAPPKAPEAPAKTPEAPPKTPEAPAKTPEAPAKTPEAPPKTPEAPPKAPEAPPKAPEAPAKAPEAPAKTPEAPPKTPEAPAKTPEAPAKTPEAPPKAPEAPSKAPGSDIPKETKPADVSSRPVTPGPTDGRPADGPTTVKEPVVVGGRAGGPGTVARKPLGKKPKGDEPSDGMDQYKDFLSKNAQNMAFNLQAGSDIERELREILDAFVEECRYCLCQDEIPKSKFYAICYKILHQGLMTLTCKEMAYAHKKIYNASEKLYPGYLCQIIITDLNATNSSLLKCCDCKGNLCCSDSHEMLCDKATRIEREVSKARLYLSEIRKQQLKNPIEFEDEDSEDRNQTFRQKQPSSSKVKCSGGSKLLSSILKSCQ